MDMKALSIVAPMRANPQPSPVRGVTESALKLVPDAVGPFSPIEGPHSVGFTGSPVALKNVHRVDLPPVESLELNRVVEAKDADGHTWFVTRRHSWMVSAFRERTEEELTAFFDRRNGDLRSSIPFDRISACRLISIEVVRMAYDLRPERCPSRSQRRHHKYRLEALARLQVEVLSGRRLTMADVRSRMEDLGVDCPQYRD